MIPYHGTPITPDTVAVSVLKNRHALVSFAYPQQIELVANVCQSFIIDNGAFTFWRKKKIPDWAGYNTFVDEWRKHPAFDWALIPDVIDGSEKDNDRLIAEWPFPLCGVPVWHLHESLERLLRLVEKWPRIALGSSGVYSKPGNNLWWIRMRSVLDNLVDTDRNLITKLHGLRMLNPKLTKLIPFSSADSSNIARNINLDKKWSTGNYLPTTKAGRAHVMADRIENIEFAVKWEGILNEQS